MNSLHKTIVVLLLLALVLASPVAAQPARPADPTWPSVGQPVQLVPGAAPAKPGALFAAVVTAVEPLSGAASLTVFPPGAPPAYLVGVGNCSLSPEPCWVPLP